MSCVLGPEAADEVEGLDRVLAHLQGAQARRLDRRAVGHGIGEGQAELDDVGPGLRQALEDRERGLRIRIAGHHIGDERGAAFRAALLEAGFDALGHGRVFSMGRCGMNTNAHSRPKRHGGEGNPCRCV